MTASCLISSITNHSLIASSRDLYYPTRGQILVQPVDVTAAVCRHYLYICAKRFPELNRVLFCFKLYQSNVDRVSHDRTHGVRAFAGKAFGDAKGYLECPRRAHATTLVRAPGRERVASSTIVHLNQLTPLVGSIRHCFDTVNT